MKALYNRIGGSYDQTRKSDPFLVERLVYHLKPTVDEAYLDIGCGTGNYTSALCEKGGKWTGVDVSSEMLRQARQKSPQVAWVMASVSQLPFTDAKFAGGIATLTIHHWPDLALGFQELARVLKGDLVLFTSFPKQMQRYWLNHYFPIMMERSLSQMPTSKSLDHAIQKAGWSVKFEEKYFIKEDLKDRFLFSGKHQPSFYLDPTNRDGISSFRNLCPEEELNQGLKELERDLQSGDFNHVQEQYDNDQGDYMFIKAGIR